VSGNGNYSLAVQNCVNNYYYSYDGYFYYSLNPTITNHDPVYNTAGDITCGNIYCNNISNTSGTIAIGSTAGKTSQSASAIAIGDSAGRIQQGSSSIAIGYHAGETNLGNNSIAIGSNTTCSYDNSIVIDATNSTLNATASNATYIAPIRSSTDNSLYSLVYDSTSKEILCNTTKSFIIEHPVDENRYLVHACLEGPENGVYYRGKGEITNNESVKIELPYYVDKFANDFTIQITPIFSGKRQSPISLETTEIEDNSFHVYGENAKFYWIVYGKRSEIVVEPLKTSVEVKGNGPYKWI
jgi:hypothetical protein